DRRARGSSWSFQPSSMPDNRPTGVRTALFGEVVQMGPAREAAAWLIQIARRSLLPMMRHSRPILACLLVAGACALAASAGAAEPLWTGFQDDPALRWRDNRAAAFNRVRQLGASVVRTTVYWNRMAPRRPKLADNPFDRAYRFNDLDEFVRNAETRG